MQQPCQGVFYGYVRYRTLKLQRLVYFVHGPFSFTLSDIHSINDRDLSTRQFCVCQVPAPPRIVDGVSYAASCRKDRLSRIQRVESLLKPHQLRAQRGYVLFVLRASAAQLVYQRLAQPFVLLRRHCGQSETW